MSCDRGHVSISPLHSTLMFHSRFCWRSLLLAGLAATLPAAAQDSGALLDALIRKGILTNQEAEDIRADLVRDNNTIPAHAVGGGKAADRLSVGMRMQVQ